MNTNIKKKANKQASISSLPASPPLPSPDHEEIARLAYSYWEARGSQDGSAQDDWLRAEQEIRSQR